MMCTGEHSHAGRTIIGSVVGLFLVMIILLPCSILGVAIYIKNCKEQHINVSEVETAEPTYDTIDPAYEVIAQQNETKLTVNDAYNF